MKSPQSVTMQLHECLDSVSDDKLCSDVSQEARSRLLD